MLGRQWREKIHTVTHIESPSDGNVSSQWLSYMFKTQGPAIHMDGRVVSSCIECAEATARSCVRCMIRVNGGRKIFPWNGGYDWRRSLN